MADDERLSADEQVEIVLLMLDREQEGIVRLLRAYARRVKLSLLRHFQGILSEEEADEVIQEAAFKAWEKAEKFDDADGTLGGWFYIIAYHTAVDALRRLPDGDQRPLPLEIEPEFTARVPAVIDEDEELSTDECNALLMEIETLGEKQRVIIKADMAAGGEADTEYLAKKLGVSKQTIYSYRNKAHKALRRRLERHGMTAGTLRTKS